MGFRLSLASDVQAGLDRLRDFEFTFVLANIEALGDDPVLACSHLSAARGQHRDAWALVLIDVHEAHSETYRELVGAGADLVHPGAPARDSLYEWVRLAELRSISNGFDART